MWLENEENLSIDEKHEDDDRKKSYTALNTQQFHLKLAQTRPKSCNAIKVTGNTGRDLHQYHVRRCQSQQNIASGSYSRSGYQDYMFDLERINNGIKSQMSSALRRPHASCYSLLDSQCTPEPAKPRRPAYRAKSASTVYSYAEEPVSACEISNHLGRQTKTSLLRSKSSADPRVVTCDSHSSLKRKITRKPCAVREEYRKQKSSLSPKEVLDYMNSIHAFLTGARYNRSRLLDAKSLSKHGLYVSKEGLESFIMDKAKTDLSTPKDEQPSTALKAVESKTSSAVVVSVGTNTEVHYLSCQHWHDAEWQKAKKNLPARKGDSRRAVVNARKVKCIKTQYIDYDKEEYSS